MAKDSDGFSIGGKERIDEALDRRVDDSRITRPDDEIDAELDIRDARETVFVGNDHASVSGEARDREGAPLPPRGGASGDGSTTHMEGAAPARSEPAAWSDGDERVSHRAADVVHEQSAVPGGAAVVPGPPGASAQDFTAAPIVDDPPWAEFAPAPVTTGPVMAPLETPGSATHDAVAAVAQPRATTMSSGVHDAGRSATTPPSADAIVPAAAAAAGDVPGPAEAAQVASPSPVSEEELAVAPAGAPATPQAPAGEESPEAREAPDPSVSPEQPPVSEVSEAPEAP
ncbi:MAG: hypothetical protein H6977_03980, partial [Gammaproteobacteria bacterium]|nr:hypothetical protein [Gammaproteobacteria bacterium]